MGSDMTDERENLKDNPESPVALKDRIAALEAEVAELRKDAERWRFQDALPDLSPYLREYHSGVLLSTEVIDAAMKEAQS